MTDRSIVYAHGAVNLDRTIVCAAPTRSRVCGGANRGKTVITEVSRGTKGREESSVTLLADLVFYY